MAMYIDILSLRKQNSQARDGFFYKGIDQS